MEIKGPRFLTQGKCACFDCKKVFDCKSLAYNIEVLEGRTAYPVTLAPVHDDDTRYSGKLNGNEIVAEKTGSSFLVGSTNYTGIPVCPDCHKTNIAVASEKPCYLIAMVGRMSAGKTSLCDSMVQGGILNSLGCAFNINADAVGADSVVQAHSTIPGTATKKSCLMLDRCDLCWVDVAGETFLDNGKNDSFKESLRQFIKDHADAVLVLIPSDIRYNPVYQIKPEDSNHSVAMNLGKYVPKEIPVKIVLTKSDKLRSDLQKGPLTVGVFDRTTANTMPVPVCTKNSRLFKDTRQIRNRDTYLEEMAIHKALAGDAVRAFEDYIPFHRRDSSYFVIQACSSNGQESNYQESRGVDLLLLDLLRDLGVV